MKLAIADDQSVVREGLKAVLEAKGEGEVRVVLTVPDGETLLAHLDRQTPDLCLVDIDMPGLGGIETARRLKQKYPQIKVVLLTTFIRDDYIDGGLAAGIDGYLLKSQSPEKILEALTEVMKGGAFIEPQVLGKVLGRMKETVLHPAEELPLTEREREIVAGVGRGLNNREIARELFISVGTVKNHLTHVLGKLELRDRTQLAIFAIERRIGKEKP